MIFVIACGMWDTFESDLFPFELLVRAVELMKELKAEKKDRMASGSLCHTKPAICYDKMFSNFVHHFFPLFFFLVYYFSLPLSLSRHVLDLRW